MANVRASNTLYADTTGTLITVTGKPLKATHILHTTNAAGDLAAIDDGSVRRLILRGALANSSVVHDFSANPIVFQTSVVVGILTANSALTIVFKQE